MTGPNELRRSLGFTDLMLITIGTVIGSGIYLVPSLVLRQTGGHTGLAFTVWAVAGFLSLLGALTYAELGAMKPEAGGLYAYLRDAFGPLPAFLYGWASFLVIASGSIAALAVAFANYLSPLLPFRVPGPIISLVVILVVALINGYRQRPARGLIDMPSSRGSDLTSREWEVLDFMRDGLSTREIADRLLISEVTVRRHISSVLKKLDVPTRTEALKLLQSA